jgi:hypothetical protein
MEEDKKACLSRYVSIFFQVWTKYLVMYIYVQSRIKRREKTVEKFPLNKKIKLWKY